MSASIYKCKDEQILKDFCSIFRTGLVQKELIDSTDAAKDMEETYQVICDKYGVAKKTAEFIMNMTFKQWFSLNLKKVETAYDVLVAENKKSQTGNAQINVEYYLPLLKDFCNKTLPLYDKGYDQGPFIPYTMPKYESAPVKIMYVGRDTYYWEPIETLKEAYKESRLEDYLDANTKCVDVNKMLTWKNNSGSFWNFANKLHLLIRTGQLVSDITTISEEQKDILEEIGYGNLYSIELLETLRKRYEEPGLLPTTEYHSICEAAKPFESLKTMIEAYQPDYIFVLSWIEKPDFFDGTDFQWQKDWYTDCEKKYRAVYLSKQYKTKVIWSLHPNAMWRKGLCKEDTDNLIRFLANTLKELKTDK